MLISCKFTRENVVCSIKLLSGHPEQSQGPQMFMHERSQWQQSLYIVIFSIK